MTSQVLFLCIHKQLYHTNFIGSNVLLDDFARAKITGFETSLFFTNDELTETYVKHIKTTNFMAPEAVRGGHSSKSDLW